MARIPAQYQQRGPDPLQRTRIAVGNDPMGQAIERLGAAAMGVADNFFSFIDNSRGEGNSTLVASLADVPKWADNNLRERLQAALEEARAAGLDESLYQGFRADGRQAADVPAARNADRAGDGGRPEPGDRGEVTAAAQPETAIDAATRLTSETPDLNVYLDENGPPISLADAMSEIEAERQRATRDADGYTAAANCFLRNGDA